MTQLEWGRDGTKIVENHGVSKEVGLGGAGK